MPSLTSLLGEFECRIDDKNRIIFPSKLKRQLPLESEGKFTIINGIDSCLDMYPQNEWNLIVEKINNLDQFNFENREFIHYYYFGQYATALDSQSRLLLPKSKLTDAGIDKDIILFACSNRIEIWDKEKYLSRFAIKPDDFAKRVQNALGAKKQNEPI